MKLGAENDSTAINSAKLALSRCLVYSADWKLAKEGLSILDELQSSEYSLEACCLKLALPMEFLSLSVGNPSDIAFLRCLGLLHSGAFLSARQSISALTLSEPTNTKAEALLELWKESALLEGSQALKITGVIIAGLVVVGLAVYALWPRSRAELAHGGRVVAPRGVPRPVQRAQGRF